MTLIELALATAAALTGVPEQEIGCMATNIYHEARGESLEGQWLVGSVVMNRVVSNKFPGTPCDVVHEWRRPGLFGCQFSWYCDGRSDKMFDEVALLKAVIVSVASVALPASDLTHYHELSVNPTNWEELEPVGVVGGHLFYKQRASEGEG